MNNYTGTVLMCGIKYPSTTSFDFWFKNVEGVGAVDFLVLREAVQNRCTTLPYHIEVKFDKTYVRHMSWQLVLVLTIKGREAFLKVLDHACAHL